VNILDPGTYTGEDGTTSEEQRDQKSGKKLQAVQTDVTVDSCIATIFVRYG